MTVQMKFTQVAPEQVKEQLRGEIANLEMQIYARRRDLVKWQALDVKALKASAVDPRWANNATEERKTQIGGATYDIEKLEIALRLTQAEYAVHGGDEPEAEE